MNDKSQEVFESTKVEAQNHIEQSTISIRNAINELDRLMRVYPLDTPLNLIVQNIIENENVGLEKKIDELRDVKSQIVSLLHMEGSGEPIL